MTIEQSLPLNTHNKELLNKALQARRNSIYASLRLDYDNHLVIDQLIKYIQYGLAKDSSVLRLIKELKDIKRVESLINI